MADMFKIHNIHDVIGFAGTIVSVLLFLSPVKTFLNIYKRKSVEDFSVLPYLATFLNCCLWTLYGLPYVKPNNISVIITNVIGVSLEIIYVITYVFYSTEKARLKVITMWFVETIVFVAITLGVLLGTHNYEMRAKVVGGWAILLNIIMYGSPLSIMKTVMKTKSVKYMPLYISIFSFLNGVVWTSYAFLPFDLNIIIPNGLGILLSSLQLGLYVCYYKSTPEGPESTKLEMNNNV